MRGPHQPGARRTDRGRHMLRTARSYVNPLIKRSTRILKGCVIVIVVLLPNSLAARNRIEHRPPTPSSRATVVSGRITERHRAT